MIGRQPSSRSFERYRRSSRSRTSARNRIRCVIITRAREIRKTIRRHSTFVRLRPERRARNGSMINEVCSIALPYEHKCASCICSCVYRECAGFPILYGNLTWVNTVHVQFHPYVHARSDNAPAKRTLPHSLSLSTDVYLELLLSFLVDYAAIVSGQIWMEFSSA